MSHMTFKDFLRILDEDTDSDIANLTMQKQQLLVRKSMADRQIDAQIGNIDKALFQKEKQKQNETQKNKTTSPQQQPQQQAQPQGGQTTTPGSTGQQTPGRGSLSAAPGR